MLSDIVAVAAADGLRIAPSAVTIDHLGYDGDQRRKRLRDIPLLRSRLAEEPGHVYSWQHLGHALDDLGDGDGARAAWLRGIEAARRKAEASPADVLAYAAFMHRELDRGADISSLLDEATVRFPGSPLVAWIGGRALMRRGRFAEALPILAALAAVDAETLVEDRLAYDVRIFGVWAVAGLALCCFRLGRYEESARHYARAEALAPEDPGHGVRRRLAEARARRAAPSAAGTSVAAARA
jgi:tetratricopeptide (TPR) repeat protein